MAARNQVQPPTDSGSPEGLGQDPRLLICHQMQDTQVSDLRPSLVGLENKSTLKFVTGPPSKVCGQMSLYNFGANKYQDLSQFPK